MTPSPPRRSTVAVAIAVIAAAALHIAYLRFQYDDAYITYRYADHLARGLGLVFNAGERVEGYSNFLWAVVLAAVIRAGGDPETWAPALGAAAMLGALTVTLFAAARARVPILLTGVLVAANTAWAAWGTGGLETGLFTLAVTTGTIAIARTLRSPAPGRWVLASGFALGIASLVRPDGPLFVAIGGAFLGGAALRGRLPWIAPGAFAGLVAVLVLPHLLWRRLYYGDWVPNTYHVKAPGPWRLETGAEYLGSAFLDLHLAFFAVPLLVAWAGRIPMRGRETLAFGPLAVAVAAHAAYVATTGGDFMPAYRLVAPVLPLAGLLAAAALAGIGDRRASGGRAITRVVAAVALAAYAGLHVRGSVHQQAVWSKGELVSVGWARQEMDDWGRIGTLLGRIAAPTDTLAISPAGIIPYRSRLHTIDMNGLTVRDLSRFRRRDTRRPGHEITLHERWLAETPPQILLGHPLVHPTPATLALGLELRPEWHDRVLAEFQSVGLTLLGEPLRFVGCALRHDAADRILEAGRAANAPP